MGSHKILVVDDSEIILAGLDGFISKQAGIEAMVARVQEILAD